MIKGMMLSIALTMVCSLWYHTADGQSKDPLLFPKEDFTVENKTVTTSLGEKQITYRVYRHIPYMANPVDKD